MFKKIQGFTLIELLIVVVLIGILSGVLLSVIQPGAQRLRAEEATAGANVNKLQLAMAACMAKSLDPFTTCTSFESIAANNPSGEPRAETRYEISITRDASGNTWGIANMCLDGNYSYEDCPANTCRMQVRVNADTGSAEKSSRGCSIDF